MIARAKGAASIKDGLREFFRCFIYSITEKNILFDNPVLLENVEVWITTLSSAASRPLRHTATVASLEIIRTLANSGNKFATQTAHYFRQSGTESRKAGNNKNRVASIERSAKIASQKQEVIDNLIKDWVDIVFIHRYRDVDPKIRVDCVEALGDWVMLYPDHFLDGSHLRYLGWMLSDPSPSTRLEVIKKLHSIFADEKKVIGLKTFSERFRKRMVEMATRDADIGVRASTICLLLSLRKAGLLEPNDIDSIGRLIYCVEQRVRTAVAEFFAENVKDLYNSVMDDLGGEEAIDDVISSSNTENLETPRVEWITYKCLAQILKGYDIDDNETHPVGTTNVTNVTASTLAAEKAVSHYSLAAKELYHHIQELKCGDILAAYLLFDHSGALQNSAPDDVEARFKYECKLDEAEEIILMEILVVSIEERLLDSDHKSSGRARKTKSQHDNELEQRQSLIKHFATLYPRLLKKFGSSPEAASIILRLEHVLNVEVMEEIRHKSGALSTLLNDIKRQFTSHANEVVIAEASASLLHVKGLQEYDEMTESVINSIWDDMSNNLSQLRKDKDLSIRGNLRPDSLTALSDTVLRIENLARISDCTEALEAKLPQKSTVNESSDSEECGVDILINLVQRGIPTKNLISETNAIEDTVVIRASRSIIYYFMWKITKLKSSTNDGEMASDILIRKLVIRKECSIANITHVVNSRRRADHVRLSAAGSLLDIATLFATLRNLSLSVNYDNRSANVGKSTSLSALTKTIDTSTQRNLLQVLDAAMTDFAAKSGRILDKSKGRAANGPLVKDDEDEEQDFDEDPISDSDSDADNNPQTEPSNATKVLAAEKALCDLTGKMVLSILAGVLDDVDVKENNKNQLGPVRRQMESYKTRLGNNFREVVSFLATSKTENTNIVSMKSRNNDESHQSKAKSREIIPLSDGEHDGDTEKSGHDEDSSDNINNGEGNNRNGNYVEQSNDRNSEGENRNNSGDSNVESLLGD